MGLYFMSICLVKGAEPIKMSQNSVNATASDLVLHCLLMSHKMELGYMG